MIELLKRFAEADARYLVVGGYAVGIHAQPRFTKDLDIWVEPTALNAERVFAALRKFGAPLRGVTPADFATPGTVFQLGIAPNRVDVLTEVSGLGFQEAFAARHHATLREVDVDVLGLNDLIRNKRASARPQDLRDVEALEKARLLAIRTKRR